MQVWDPPHLDDASDQRLFGGLKGLVLKGCNRVRPADPTRDGSAVQAAVAVSASLASAGFACRRGGGDGLLLDAAEEHHVHTLLGLEHALDEHLSGGAEPPSPTGGLEDKTHDLRGIPRGIQVGICNDT